MKTIIENNLPVRAIMTAFFLSTGTMAAAREFYVAKQGDDHSAGTRQAPFATIQNAASVMQPGDVCYISAGTYTETVIPKDSGTDDYPIIFKPASAGDHVVLTGAEIISHDRWESVGKNRFKCTIKLPLQEGNQLFSGERSMVEARWPNVGDDLLKPTLAVMGKGTTPEQILCPELPDYDFAGGRVWVHAPMYWENWTTEISGYGNKTLQIRNKAPFEGRSKHVSRENAEFFVYNILDALDADNEWYYDSGEQALYIFRSDGKLPIQPYLIKTKLYVLDVSGRQHLEFHGITIVGASVLSDQKAEDILFNRLKLFYPFYNSKGNGVKSGGFVLNGKNNTIQNSEIAYSSGPCITLDGENNKLLNSYVHDGNLFGAFTGCVLFRGKANIISHCTITRSGRTLINYSGMYQALVQNCDLSDAGMLTSDLGLTYGTNIEGGNSEIRYNLMHGNHGQDKEKNMGLYYDHGTKNVISHHNIVWGADYAGLLINHYANGHLIYNNTFIGKKYGFRSVWGHKYAPDLLNCRFINNLFAGAFSTTADNYFATNNVTGYTDFDATEPMVGYPAGYGKGLFIEGITPAIPTGLAGIGAIEYKGMTFKAGCDFDNQPDYDFARSRPAHRNLLENAAFEHEDHFYPWQVNALGVVPIKHKTQYHSYEDINIGRMGSYSVELPREGSELFQCVSGLKSGEYAFISQLRVMEGEAVVNGVRFPNGTELFSQQVTSGAPGWKRCRLNFKVPGKVTSVEVFIRRLSHGEDKTVYVDDLSLTLQ